MKQTRKFLSLLLALVLCLGLLPVTAMANETVDKIHSSLGPPPPPEPDKGSTRVEVIDGGPDTVEVIDRNDKNKDDQPVAEDNYLDGPYRVSFLAAGGKFSDGTTGATLLTVEGPDERYLCRVQFPKEDPSREGYVFSGWCYQSDVNFQNPVTDPEYVTADSVMCAKWTPVEPSQDEGTPWWLNHPFKLDPNGGTVSPDTFMIDQDGKIVGRLPTPTRPGYTFQGWYIDGKPVDESKFVLGVTATAPFLPVAQWAKDAAKTSFRVDFYPNGGTITSIRGLPAKDIVAGSTKAQENKVFVDGKSGVGMMMTGEDGRLDSLPKIEREGYTLDGWCQGGTKVTESTVFKADANLTAKWTKADPNGPFTVKFDLGYKNAPKTETPKDLSVAKGSVMDLPDGKKLTPPAANYEFYAWCLQADDGKLYPWNEQHTVSADMTLVAGWVRKGTTVKAGEAVPEVSGTAAPSASGKSAFTDVPATSPFAKAIAWAVEKGITNGTTPTTFSPGTTCSTGHILTFLWRANGSPEPTIENPYKDEIPNAFKKAAIWAHEKGLVSGDTFGSATPCTRAASVTYMWKLAGSPEAKAASFKDVSASSDYAKAISWAVEKGVTKGTGDGTTFSPENICTRGQIVTFLNRAYAE